MISKDAQDRKKKRGILPLKEQMGLDRGTDYEAPPAPNPGILAGSAQSELNERENGSLNDRVRSRLQARKGV